MLTTTITDERATNARSTSVSLMRIDRLGDIRAEIAHKRHDTPDKRQLPRDIRAVGCRINRRARPQRGQHARGFSAARHRHDGGSLAVHGQG